MCSWCDWTDGLEEEEGQNNSGCRQGELVFAFGKMMMTTWKYKCNCEQDVLKWLDRDNNVWDIHDRLENSETLVITLSSIQLSYNYFRMTPCTKNCIFSIIAADIIKETIDLSYSTYFS